MSDYNLNEDTFGNPQKSSASNESFLDKVSKRANDNLAEGRYATGQPQPIFQQFDPVPFSTYQTNYYRYARRNNFDELGFSPYGDNDSIYNAESNFFGETWRGLQGAAITAFNTGLDGWEETANIISGGYGGFSEWWNSYDEGSAMDFADVNRIYGSTKGGATGFIANGVLNTGFVGGMLIGSLPELAVEALITAEAGGTGALAGVVKAIGRGAKGLNRGRKALDEVADVAKDARKAQSTILENANNRQAASGLANAMNSTLGSAYLNLTDNVIAKALNPFSNTGTWINDALRTSKTTGNVTLDAARGIGAVMEDLVVVKGAKLESSMEAGFSANSIRTEYYNKFVEENGRVPNPNELREIEQLAAMKASESIMINMPVIMYTDKLLFNPLFRAGRRLSKSLDLGPSKGGVLPNGIDYQKGKGFSVDGPDITNMSLLEGLGAKAKYAFKGLAKPKSWSSFTKAVVGSGLGEGFQEGVQETTSTYLDAKYKDILENPMNLPLQSNASYIADAAKELFVEGTQGWHAVASGMFVGGLFGAGGGKLQKLASLALKENRENYLDNELKRRQYLEEITEILNENYKDPYQLLNENVRTFKEMNDLNKEYQQIRIIESVIGLDETLSQRKKEIADQMLFTKLTTALSTGTYDIFKERLMDMRNMDDVSLLEATGEENADDVRNKIDEYLERTEKIKDRYNEVSDKYRNPFDYSNLSITDPSYGRVRSLYDSYEQAKRQLIFLSDEVDKIKGLREEYENKLRQSPVSKNWGAEDTTSVMSLEAADREIALLEEEILGEAGATTPEEKKVFTSKKKKLAALTAYRKEFDKYLKVIESLKEDLNAKDPNNSNYKKRVEAADKVKDKLEAYVKASDAANVALGAEPTNFENLEQSLDEFLNTIIDFNLNNKDLSAAIDLLNALDNPQALNSLAQREQAAKEDVFANKKRHIKASVDLFQRSIEKNEILQDLKKIGVVIDGQELFNFLNNGELPTKLYSLENLTELGSETAKYKEAMSIIEPYAKAVKDRVAEEEAKTKEAAIDPRSSILGQMSNSMGIEVPPGQNTQSSTTGNANPTRAKEIIESFKTREENEIDLYRRLASEVDGVDVLVINYLENSQLPYTLVVDLLADPAQGPQVLALLTSVVKAYKEAKVTDPIQEWVATSAASQSTIINNAVASIYNGSLSTDAFLSLISSVEAVGNIENNLNENENVITPEILKQVVQEINAEAKAGQPVIEDIDSFISFLEAQNYFVTGEMVEVPDPTDPRLTTSIPAYRLKDSRGIIVSVVHGDRDYFTGLQYLYRAFTNVTQGVKQQNKEKRPGKKLYLLDGVSGHITSATTVYEDANGNRVKILGFEDVDTQGTKPVAGRVKYQHIKKDGSPRKNSKPKVMKAADFANKYTSIKNVLSVDSYRRLPKFNIGNVAGVEYTVKDEETLEKILNILDQDPKAFLNRLSFRVEENTSNLKEREWGVTIEVNGQKETRVNPLINRQKERSTIKVYLTTADNQEIMLGFLNDPRSYVFKDVDGKKGNFDSSTVKLIDGIHYSLKNGAGQVSLDQLKENYSKQDLLYTYLDARKGSTITFESLQSELGVEFSLQRPSYIFDSDKEKVLFKDLKYKTYKGEIVVWDNAEKKLVGLERLSSENSQASTPGESRKEARAFRKEVEKVIENNESRFQNLGSRFILVSEFAGVPIFTELTTTQKTSEEFATILDKMKSDSEYILGLAKKAEDAGEEFDLSQDEKGKELRDNYLGDELFTGVTIEKTDKVKTSSSSYEIRTVSNFRAFVNYGFTKDGRFKIEFKHPQLGAPRRLVFNFGEMIKMFESEEMFFDIVNSKAKKYNKDLKARASVKYEEGNTEQEKAVKGARAARKMLLPEDLSIENLFNNISPDLKGEEDFNNLKSNVRSRLMVNPPKIKIKSIPAEGLGVDVAEEIRQSKDEGPKAEEPAPVAEPVKETKTEQQLGIEEQHKAVQQLIVDLNNEINALSQSLGLDAPFSPEYMQLSTDLEIAINEEQRLSKLLGYSIVDTYSPESEAQLEDFLGWTRAVLPDFISVETSEKIAQRMRTEGITVGRFIMSVESAARNINDLKGIINITPDSPSKYHEAFHSVFRMMLTEQEIKRALKQGARELRSDLRKKGRTLEDEMVRFRRLSDFYAEMSEIELRERIVEEYLADKFEEFKKNPKGTKTAASNKSLFRKIIDFLINLFTDYPAKRLTEIEELFEAIDRGDYKNAVIRDNRFTSAGLAKGESVAYSILPIGNKQFTETIKGEPVTRTIETFLNAEDNIKLLNGITADVYNRMKGIVSSGDNVSSSIEDLIAEAVKKYHAVYNPSRVEFYNTPEKVERARNLQNALVRSAKRVEFTNEEGETTSRLEWPLIQEYVEDAIKMYDAVAELDEDAVDEMGGAVRFFENSETQDPLKGLPTIVRALIGTTTVQSSDAFGNSFFLDENGNIDETQRIFIPASMHTIYNGLVRVMADSFNEVDMFERLLHYRNSTQGKTSHEEINMFINEIFKKFNLISIEEAADGTQVETLSFDNVTNTQLYQAFVKSMNKSKRDYLFYSVDVANSEVRVFTANRNGETSTQYDMWKEAWEYKFSDIRDNKDLRAELASVLKDLGTFINVNVTPEEFEADQEYLVELLTQLENLSGIELSLDYVTYSYYANMLEAEKISLEEVPVSIAFQYQRLNIPFLRAEIGSTQKSDFNILSSLITKDAGRGLFMRDYAFEGEVEETESQEEFKNESTLTAGGRLKTIASGNVYFNANVDVSTFSNAEGNNIQSYQAPTVLIQKVNELNSPGKLDQLEQEDPYFEGHWLLQSESFRKLAEARGITTQSIDGIKAMNHKVSKNFGMNQRPGHVFADFTEREWLLAMISNYVKRSVEFEDMATAPVFMRVLEASKTGVVVNLPTVKAVQFESNPISAINKSGFSFTSEFNEIVMSDLLRDLNRIERVAKERSDSGSLNDVADYADVVYDYNVIKESAINNWIAEELEANPDVVPTKKDAVAALEGDLRGLQINSDYRLFLLDGYIAKGMSAKQAEEAVRKLEISARTKGEMEISEMNEYVELINLGMHKHFVEDFLELMANEGFLYRHNGGYTFDTQSKGKQSRNPLIGVLGANALSFMPQNQADKLNLIQDFIQGENNDSKNVELDQRKLETNLAQIFFSNFINARAINQLNTGDQGVLYKSGIDAVKRAKGLNASGISTDHNIIDPSKGITHSFNKKGDLQHIMFESDEFVGKYSNDNQERDDGQLYMTVKGLRHILFGMGRLSNYQSKILDRLQRGDEISLEDVFGSAKKRGTIQYNAQTSSLKLVYFDGKNYLKMSAFVLTPEFTGREGDKSNLKDINGNTQGAFLDNLRRVMEAREKATNSVVLASPESASKSYKPNIISRQIIEEVSGNTDAEILDDFEDTDFNNLEPKYLMLSTEVPSNKKEITDPTQMMNLILSELGPEQADEVVYVNGEKTTIGALKQEYLDNGAKLLRAKYFAVRDEFFDIPDVIKQIRLSRDLNKVSVKLDEFRKYAVRTLKEIGAPQQEIDVFEDPDIDLNNSFTYNRFQNLVLSKFSKGVFKQKTKGYKLTLLSDSGISVIRRKNTAKQNGLSVDSVVTYKDFKKETAGMNQDDIDSLYYKDSLAYNVEVYNESGKVIERYSEMMMPQHSEDQQLNEGLFAVRIPSQDKHSALSARVVDFMPAHYGSVGVFPKELLELSGADFDIDSVFVHAPETFRNQLNEVVRYGDPNISDKDQMYAYFTYLYKVNSDFRDAYGQVDESLNLRAINNKKAQEAAKILGLPHNIEEYKKAVKDNGGVSLIPYDSYNRLLDIKRAILSSDYLNTPIEGESFGIAQEPANLKPFKDFEKWLKSEEGLSAWIEELDRSGRITDSMVGQIEAFSDIQEGAAGIGPSVNMAVDFSIINAFGLETPAPQQLIYDGRNVSDFTKSLNPEQKRKMNILSAIITGMTDNAKEQLAKKYGLNTEVVGQLSYLIAGGMPFKDAILLFNQPVVKEFYKQSKNATSNVKFTKDETKDDAIRSLYKAIGKKIQELKSSQTEEGSVSEDEAVEVTEEEANKSLNLNDLILGLQHGSKNFYQIFNKMSLEELEIQRKVLRFVEEVSTASQVFADFSALTKLSRGTGKTIADFDRYVELAVYFTQGNYIGIKGVPDFKRLFAKGAHSVLRAQVSALLEMNALFPKMFITRSEVLNATKLLTLGAMGPKGFMQGEFNKAFVKDFVGIAMSKAYMHDVRNKGSLSLRNVSNDLIYQSLSEKSGTTDIVTIVKGLRDYLDSTGKPSKFISDYLRSSGATNLDGSKNPKNRDGVNKISVNSFTKLSPQAMHIFNSEFVELFTNTEVIKEGPLAGTTVRGAVMDLLHYLLVKDGLTFRSGTFLQYVPKVALKDVIKVMGNVVEAFKDIPSAQADLVKVFGQNYLAFVQEFLINWPRHASSFNYNKRLFLANYSKDTAMRELRDKMLIVDEDKGLIGFNFWGGLTEVEEGEARDPKEFIEYLKKASRITKTLGFDEVIVNNTKDGADQTKTAFPMYITHNGELYKVASFKPGRGPGVNGYKGNLYFDQNVIDFTKRSKGFEARILMRTSEFVKAHSSYPAGTPTLFGSQVIYEKVGSVGETSQFGGGYVFGELPKYVKRQKTKKKTKKTPKGKPLDVKTYEGKIKSLESNQIFVFGSNPEGRHGKGAALTAKEKFQAEYGVGRGLTGQSYALVTKNLAAGFVEESTGITYEKSGEQSVSKEQIIDNIKEMYDKARELSDKEFMVAYTVSKNLNGYSSQEMADMFVAAGPIPGNVIFNDEFAELLIDKNAAPQALESLESLEFEDMEMLRDEAAERAEDSEKAAIEEAAKNQDISIEALIGDPAMFEKNAAESMSLFGDLFRSGVKESEKVSDSEIKKAFKEVKDYKDSDGTSISLDSFTEAVNQAGNTKDAVENIKNCYRK